MASLRTILDFPLRRSLAGFTPIERALTSSDVEDIVARFPGAAAYLRETGELVQANNAAAPLILSLVEPRADRVVRERLLALIAKCGTGRPTVDRLAVAHPDDPASAKRIFDVTFIPVPRGVLLLAQESTLERNLITALTQSRELFRDLVYLSSAFAWETDEKGAFTFVSKTGAVGYSSQALHGRLAESLVVSSDEDDAMPSAMPFYARTPVEDAEVWLRCADGSSRCFLVSASPIVDEAGRRRGARGVSHDVTSERKRDAELRRIQTREALARAVVDAVRSDPEPSTMLAAAAEAVRSASGADRVWIVEPTSNVAGWSVLHVEGQDKSAKLPLEAARALAQLDGTTDTPAPFTGKDDIGLAVTTCYQGAVNGAIVIARSTLNGGFDMESASLLQSVSSHLGVALAHAKLVRTLEEQSSTDVLTGLMNRRAFTREATRRLEQHRRMNRTAVFMFLDLDDFKLINDEHGHAAGDTALKALGDQLRGKVRAGDLVVRFGGDEFGIWLEESDAAIAESKAAKIQDSLDAIASTLARPLSLSIGAAVFDPTSRETLAEIMERADTALYAAKRAGKKRLRLAPAAKLEARA